MDSMNYVALDANFNAIEFIDGYSSVIWAERYSDVGDAEIHGPYNSNLAAIISSATYILNSATLTLMVIEDLDRDHSDEDGTVVRISGRNMESVLDRRVILDTHTVVGETGGTRISEIVCDLVSYAFGTGDREWSALTVVNATDASSEKLEEGVGLEFTAGESLLAVVIEMCSAYSLGFKLTIDPSDKTFTFTVYEGEDLTVGEARIVFSDLYDNLVSSSDVVGVGHIKTAALVAGDVKDANDLLVTQLVADGSFTGLDRREAYHKVDQKDDVFDEGVKTSDMTSGEYLDALALAGSNMLAGAENAPFRDYQGAILETEACRYGEEFNLGDRVQFSPLHTTPGTARLEGVVFSDDANEGKTLGPEFSYEVD